MRSGRGKGSGKWYRVLGLFRCRGKLNRNIQRRRKQERLQRCGGKDI